MTVLKRACVVATSAILTISTVIFSGTAAYSDETDLKNPQDIETNVVGGFNADESGTQEFELPDGSTVTISASEPEPISESDLKQHGELTSEDGTSLREAAESSSIQNRDWSQVHTDAFGFFQVRHTGDFYYDQDGQV